MANDSRTYIKSQLDVSGNLVSQTAKTVTYFDEEQGYRYKINANAVKCFDGFGLPDDLSESDTARLYRLSLVLHKGSNLICYRSRNDTKPMTLKRIAAYLNVTERQATSFINRMCKRHILAKVKVTIGGGTNNQYYLSPVYFFKGIWLSYSMYALFKADLDKILPLWVKQRFNEDNVNKRIKK